MYRRVQGGPDQTAKWMESHDMIRHRWHFLRLIIRWSKVQILQGPPINPCPVRTHGQSTVSDVLILGPGEFHIRRKFGPATVNRGAALFECEWDGGRFEAGLFSGGMFRSGQFAGGIFLGGIFLGTWVGGTWEGGFDRNGIYHSRGDSPSAA